MTYDVGRKLSDSFMMKVYKSVKYWIMIKICQDFIRMVTIVSERNGPHD